MDALNTYLQLVYNNLNHTKHIFRFRIADIPGSTALQIYSIL